MWKRLDEKGVVETFICGAKQKEDAAVADFLRNISERPWASELYAVTSLGNLRLTRARSYKDGDRYDSVHVGDDAQGNIILSYQPCTTSTADVDIVLDTQLSCPLFVGVAPHHIARRA